VSWLKLMGEHAFHRHNTLGLKPEERL